MGIVARLQSYKAKLKKETNDDTSSSLQNPGTPEGHMPITSHFNVINKCGQKVSKKGDVGYEKRTDSVKNLCKKKLGNVNSQEWNQL